MKRFERLAVLTLGASGLLLADFSYEQTSRMTGGAMMSMTKLMGAFSSQAREPQRAAVYVKGNRMATVSADGAPAAGEAPAQLPPAQAQEPQTAPQPTPTAGGALGRLGGRFGGLGGLGRKKQAEPQAQPPAQQSPPPASGQPASGQNAADAGVLMEMTTETSNFSPAAVDPAKFDVPSGFKQVESETLKAMRR
jgi:hypothetical protein